MSAETICALTAAVLLVAACSNGQKYQVSRQLDLCHATNESGASTISQPVDAEFARLEMPTYRADLIFDKYPRRSLDKAAEERAPVLNAGLGLRVLTYLQRKDIEYAYIRIDNPGGTVYPYAYAQAVLKSKSPQKDMTWLLKSIQKCEKSDQD